MSSTVFLTGALALLCLIALIVSVCKHKLSKEEKQKASGFGGVFFAIGFVPMALMTLSSFRAQSPILANFFAYFRTPLSFEFTLDAVVGVGNLSFVIDFFTAILFGSTVAIALSGDFEPLRTSDHISGGAGQKDVAFCVNNVEHKELTVSYLKFCRILS